MAVEKISNDDISNYFEKQNFNAQVIEAISYLKDLSDGFEDELLSRRKFPKRFVMLDEATVGERNIQFKILETYCEKPKSVDFFDDTPAENERLELLKDRAIVDNVDEYEEIEVEEPIEDEDLGNASFDLKDSETEEPVNNDAYLIGARFSSKGDGEVEKEEPVGENKPEGGFNTKESGFDDINEIEIEIEEPVEDEDLRGTEFKGKNATASGFSINGDDFGGDNETREGDFAEVEEDEDDGDFAPKEDDLEDLDDLEVEKYTLDKITKNHTQNEVEASKNKNESNETDKKVKLANCTTKDDFNTYHKIEDFSIDTSEKENLESYAGDETITENPIKEFRFKIDQQANESKNLTLENLNALAEVSKIDVANVDFSGCEFSSIEKNKRVVSTYVKRTTYELAGLGKLEPKKWKHLSEASRITLEKFREMPSIEEFKKVQHAFGKTDVNEVVADYQRIVSRFINGGEAVLKKSIDELKNELKLLQKSTEKN